ncbi:MAG: threonine--tRNA ligase, partial [Dehalococcoidia bacterium]|nr:threonine--tRNA ligase [Dehalococcoidia bacterium]
MMAKSLDIGAEDRQAGSILEWLRARHPEMVEAALAARAEERLLDLTAPLPESQSIEILTFEDEAGREVLRHTTSHVMAQAVQRLYPGTRLAIGPAIEEGFYYDFDSEVTFGPEDLERIEGAMAEIVKADLPLRRQQMSRAEAIEFFQGQGEKFKVELLEGMPDGEVSVYSQEGFADLCRGPHLPSTGRVRAFKLLNT